jgi:2-C-methyl-D-erythritol 2,4-cyclodiphosphate synthase
MPSSLPSPTQAVELFQELRIGTGWDLHRLVPNRPFVLGGVFIEHTLGPEGHSDGDALLHAVTDALLGAVGWGDIGEWFADTNPQWANADSAQLLRQVLEKIHAHHPGFTVLQADSTVMLERPKLSPYKSALRQRLAELLGVSVERVSLKAKTAEKLGELGAGRAVLAQVTLLAYCPSLTP